MLRNWLVGTSLLKKKGGRKVRGHAKVACCMVDGPESWYSIAGNRLCVRPYRQAYESYAASTSGSPRSGLEEVEERTQHRSRSTTNSSLWCTRCRTGE